MSQKFCDLAGIPEGRSDEQRRLPPLLRGAWYGLNQAFRRRIAHLKITPDQYTVLRTLAERPGLTQRELTEFITSDPNTIASLVRRMEMAGLLRRQPDKTDRRARRLRLLPAGRHKLHQASTHAQGLQRDILSVLPAEAQEPFLRQLAMVSHKCRQAAGCGEHAD